ncbi:hypothetical protein [Parendozoicomonas sp. Alg238-R29]|uniref:hypothetical protein n=1 Tax=Parendozoicomonas sp. Alg238-R29 TaxID=2993446 RepID=UPI00248E2442|nr:hypothetical protein [Parendozoicomonas sp. Alg238-R29]
MSEKLQSFTNSKLVMAQSALNAMESEQGISRESFRQAFLFHISGVVSGLVGEVLEASLVQIGRPVEFVEAEQLLKERNVLSGGIQQIRNLVEHGWLGPVFEDLRLAQLTVELSEAQSVNVIASSSGTGSRGNEAESINSVRQLVQDIRGQLQEW